MFISCYCFCTAEYHLNKIFYAVFSDQNLFPFGLNEGDMTVPRFSGSSPRIDLCTPIPFFGTTEVALYVSSACNRFMYMGG